VFRAERLGEQTGLVVKAWVKEHARRREAVEVGRADVRLAVGPELRPQVLGDQPEDVGAGGVGGALGLSISQVRDECGGEK
jgi:hypothetical protein